MCEYPFRDTFQTDDKNTYFELIHMKGVFSKFMIYWVDFVYNGDSTVNVKKYCGVALSNFSDSLVSCQWFVVKLTG